MNLSADSSLARESAVRHEADVEARRVFDLQHGPLLRGKLLRLQEHEHVLLITMHHIVADAWSLGIFIQEFSELYRAFLDGVPNALPPLPIQYADYAVWQRTSLKSKGLSDQLKFWTNQLADCPTLLELPLDHARPAVQSHQGDSVGFRLNSELTGALKMLSRRTETTLFMVLYAGFSVLLSRLSGQTDVVVGAPVANRQRVEVEGLIGFFVNTLSLRISVDNQSTVGDLLAKVRDITLAAYGHQEVPFEQVVDAVKPIRSLSHSPIFQVALMLNNTPANGDFTLPGLTLSQVSIPRHTSQFDLALSLVDAGDTIAGAWNMPATYLIDPQSTDGSSIFRYCWTAWWTIRIAGR